MNKNFTNSLIEAISHKHLLKHEFYKAWSSGTLSLDTLRTYARQYYHHVAAFPRYISSTHALCSDIKARQVLLDNLIDEEKGAENHPELWKRFAEALGETRQNIDNEKLNPETKNLIDTFMQLSRSSYAQGLGALFAYEYQVPEIACSKIEGLKKFYGISDEQGLKFFEVHRTADVYHSNAASDLLEKLDPKEKEKALEAAEIAADALWKFLDGIGGVDEHCSTRARL